VSGTSKDDRGREGLLQYLHRLRARIGDNAYEPVGAWISEVEQSVRISDEEARILGFLADDMTLSGRMRIVLRGICDRLSRRTRSTKLGVENG
jgi:hypothetical protein